MDSRASSNALSCATSANGPASTTTVPSYARRAALTARARRRRGVRRGLVLRLVGERVLEQRAGARADLGDALARVLDDAAGLVLGLEDRLAHDGLRRGRVRAGLRRGAAGPSTRGSTAASTRCPPRSAGGLTRRAGRVGSGAGAGAGGDGGSAAGRAVTAWRDVAVIRRAGRRGAVDKSSSSIVMAVRRGRRRGCRRRVLGVPVGLQLPGDKRARLLGAQLLGRAARYRQRDGLKLLLQPLQPAVHLGEHRGQVGARLVAVTLGRHGTAPIDASQAWPARWGAPASAPYPADNDRPAAFAARGVDAGPLSPWRHCRRRSSA